jgi:hypothetical protein
MARKTYTSAVEAYLDAELEAAEAAAWRAAGTSGRASVGESVSLSVTNSIRAAVARQIRIHRGTALLALLPALVVAAHAGLNALPQLGIAPDGWLPWAVQGVTIAALTWAGLATLWHARNTWRRARGRPLVTLRFRRDQNTAERQRYQEYPSSTDVAIKLGVALAALCALLWLALAGDDQSWLSGALLALPPVVLLLAVGASIVLSGLGAVASAQSAQIDRPFRRSPPPSGDTVLDERITRLQQMRDWLKDETLRTMIDDVIGRQVAKSERRQISYSVVVGILSLLAGWLLSAISPLSALAPLLSR